ncbi:hypothetical protein QTP88_011075 [Uroleucon formosanum]
MLSRFYENIFENNKFTAAFQYTNYKSQQLAAAVVIVSNRTIHIIDVVTDPPPPPLPWSKIFHPSQLPRLLNTLTTHPTPSFGHGSRANITSAATSKNIILLSSGDILSTNFYIIISGRYYIYISVVAFSIKYGYFFLYEQALKVYTDCSHHIVDYFIQSTQKNLILIMNQIFIKKLQYITTHFEVSLRLNVLLLCTRSRAGGKGEVAICHFARVIIVETVTTIDFRYQHILQIYFLLQVWAVWPDWGMGFIFQNIIHGGRGLTCAHTRYPGS